MRTRTRVAVGLLTASLSLPMPVLAIQQSVVASRAVSARQTGSSATAVILHQTRERRTYVQFSRALRARFRRSGALTRASTERYLRDLLLDLRAHWRAERRAGVASPFDFPDL